MDAALCFTWRLSNILMSLLSLQNILIKNFVGKNLNISWNSTQSTSYNLGDHFDTKNYLFQMGQKQL